MYISDISIKNFRNYESLNLDFKDGINIIIGNNGQGKTNLLESIYVLGITKSHRSFIDNNLIQKGKKISKIKGNIVINNISKNLEIILKSKEKNLKIDNNMIKKNSDYISNMNLIIFYPEDLDLIKGSPNIRRRFLNLELSQLYSVYLNISNDYNKLLKMRNDYLKNNYFDYNYFEILTNYLIEKAVLIYKMRKKFIDKLNLNIDNIFNDITGIENLKIKYKTIPEFDDFEIDNLKLILKEKFDNNLEKERKLKSTILGPHRDDIEFYIDKLNLKNYGSQGQQRVAILSLKLSEIEIFKNYKKETPILLLDDVFSELDEIKKNNLLNYLKNNIQTIITTTDLNNINEKLIEKAKIIKIDNGKIIEEVE